MRSVAEAGAREADAYWQRRFFALVAGLGVVGLLAWACSGVVGGKPASQAPPAGSSGTGAGGRIRQRRRGAGHGGRSRAAGVPGPVGVIGRVACPRRPPRSPARRVAPAVGLRYQPARRPPRGAGGGPGKAASGNAACPAADIVLTLLASKASYGPHEQPSVPDRCRLHRHVSVHLRYRPRGTAGGGHARGPGWRGIRGPACTAASAARHAACGGACPSSCRSRGIAA